MKATKKFSSFEELYAAQHPVEAANLAEAKRRAEANEARQKARAEARRVYKELAEGARALWRIAEITGYETYDEYVALIKNTNPPKGKQMLCVLKDMRGMVGDFSAESIDSQLQYYLDSQEEA